MFLLLTTLSFALPKDFVALSQKPGLFLQMGYATSLNFTGAPLPGYREGQGWLRKEAAESLDQVREQLVAAGYGLVLYDAYRPRRASEAMLKWAHASGRDEWLEEGFIARWSEHSKGAAVDVGLLKDGKLLDMGSEWDEFGPTAAYGGVTGEALANRQKLREVMETAGWLPYEKEWWHFRYPIPDLPYLDVAYGEEGPAAPPRPQPW